MLDEHLGNSPAAFCCLQHLPQASHVSGANVTEEEIQEQLGQRPAKASLLGSTDLVEAAERFVRESSISAGGKNCS